MKLGEFEFLKSTRFWAIVIIALAGWLKTDGYITEALSICIQTIAGGFTVIRTIDRGVDKLSQ